MTTVALAGARGDELIAVQPEAELGRLFDDADPDETVAVKRAREQFRWSAGGWDVMAELPGNQHFAAASQNVREEDITTQVPCGPDVAAHVDAVRRFVDTEFTDVAIVQIGSDTESAFIDWAARKLLLELRRLP
jgi:hypothetical protein